jgi:hypothetical protein
MKPSVKFAALLILTLCAGVTFPQFTSAQTTSPNAYVYVLNRLNGPTEELDGFSADSTGALTPLPGSPFWTSTSRAASQFWTLAHTAHWLFLSDAINIYSFSIASNGALTLKSAINAQRFTNSAFNEIAALVLDRTWSTLYVREYESGSGKNSILAFKKNGTTGALTYLGSTDYPGQPLSSRLAFIGNNEYAYSGAWFAAQRNSDGTLSAFSINPPLPSNPNGDYSPSGAAADPANNLAVSFFVFDSQSGNLAAYTLAAYTADSSGNLTTSSTAATISTVYPARMSVSPAGKLLAVGGPNGLQVFHFNGSNPITPYTKRLAWTNYDLAWDTHNHLYAAENGGVHAWSITPSFWKQASPYPLSEPLALTVLSK